MNNQNSSANNNNRPAARRTANAAGTGGPRPVIIEVRPGPARGTSTTNGGGDPDPTRVIVNATRDLNLNGGGPSTTTTNPNPPLVQRRPGIGNTMTRTICREVARVLDGRSYAIMGSAALVLHGETDVSLAAVSVLVSEGSRQRRSETLGKASGFKLTESGRVRYKKQGMKNSVEVELWEPDEVRQQLLRSAIVIVDGVAVLKPTRLLSIQCGSWLALQKIKPGRRTEANMVSEIKTVEYMHRLLVLIGDAKPEIIPNITEEFMAKLAVKEPELHAAFQKSRAWAGVIDDTRPANSR
ncbi:hypothetical protein B0J18DRAFT_273258 [Chaetomium sp. MPI-SDFR-AT-0129]|nr:hypothetical protein B0J18DRAFT_273258 [Chaetomium sp. MPI-SDFR-AT-0129]